MDARELRIGNILKAAEEEFVSFPPFPIHIGDIEQIYKGMITHKYEPVPLTEEWYAKFNEDYIFEVHKEGLYIQINEISFFIQKERLKYVHQWQNLYFALTGEELTLNQ